MALPRIAGRQGQQVDLNVTFFNNGVATDPYAIRRIDIYKASVKDENLQTSVIITPGPYEANYPLPILREEDGQIIATEAGVKPGVFHLLFNVPTTYEAPQIYFDVWRFVGNAFGGSGTEGTAGFGSGSGGTNPDWDDETRWLSKCNRFWIYSDNWDADDGLIVPRLGFEPLDVKLKKPEIRTVEVGITPLPLYDFDYSIQNMIPRLTATVSIETENCESISGWVDAPCRIGIRQGSVRTNPFTIQFTINTALFLIGTYRYRVTVHLPNGESRTSDDYRFTVL